MKSVQSLFLASCKASRLYNAARQSQPLVLAQASAEVEGKEAYKQNYFQGFQDKYFSTTAPSGLKEIMAQKVPQEQERLKAIRKDLGKNTIGQISVDSVIGGMRGITGILWETSLLDPNEGIRFRGLSIPELQKKLPSKIAGGEPLPEGILWFLLTSELPTQQQVDALSQELYQQSDLPQHTLRLMESMPADTHPMTLFSQMVLSLQTGSKFFAAYEQGVNKNKLWEYYLDDTISLIAKLPAIAGAIYRRSFKDGKYIRPDPNLDWAANLVHMMGYDDEGCREMMRLYQTIHTDHEGGNVSAHATHVVGSALSDPYYSFSAGMNGLAGPLHGLANQEVLRWLLQMIDQVGNEPSKEQVDKYVKDTLASGKVVPGYGHAVLRQTDPRYEAQRQFALKHLPDFPLFTLTSKLYEIVPKILLEGGKVKNPWPNVDAHSGVLLQHYGITESRFYTVLFGVSRAIGVLSQGVWSRALGFPIERPKSIDMGGLIKLAKKS